MRIRYQLLKVDRLTIHHRITADHAIEREVLSFSECSLLRTLAVLLVICCASCFGQGPKVNGLTVAIKAAGDLPIPGATCTLLPMASTPDHTLAEVSDDLGLIRFTNLLPGNYTLTVTKAGFDKLTQSSIVIKDQPESEIQVVLSTATSAQQQANNDTFKDPTARVLELVLPSEHLFGDWGGLRPKLEESGIVPRLILVTDLAGNPTGGRSQGVTAPTSVELSLFFDLDKLFGLKGGSIFASFSERGATASRRNISATPSAPRRFLAFRHGASSMSLISRSCSTTALSFAPGALQPWMIFSSRRTTSG